MTDTYHTAHALAADLAEDELVSEMTDTFVPYVEARPRADPSRRAFIRSVLIGGAAGAIVGPEFIERITRPRTIYTFGRSRVQIHLDAVKRLGGLQGAKEAQEALAAVLSGPILQMIEQAPVISDLFKVDAFHPRWNSRVIPLEITWRDARLTDRLSTSLI